MGTSTVEKTATTIREVRTIGLLALLWAVSPPWFPPALTDAQSVALLSTDAGLAGVTAGGCTGTTPEGARGSEVSADAGDAGAFAEAGPATLRMGRLAWGLGGDSPGGGTTGVADGAGSAGERDSGASAKADAAVRATALDETGAAPATDGVRFIRVATMLTNATTEAPKASRGHARRTGRETSFGACGDSTAIGSVSPWSLREAGIGAVRSRAAPGVAMACANDDASSEALAKRFSIRGSNARRKNSARPAGSSGSRS